MARSIHASYDRLKPLPNSDIPKVPLTNGVTTLWYRAPEVCLRTNYYERSADIWSAGLVIAELLTIEPVIQGRDDRDQLQLTEKFLGTIEDEDMDSLGEAMSCRHSFVHIDNKVLGAFFDGEMEKRLLDAGADAGTIQFLNGLIKWDPVKRWTASEALGKATGESLKEAREWWQGWPRPTIDGREAEREDHHLQGGSHEDEEQASEQSVDHDQTTQHQSSSVDVARPLDNVGK